MNLPTSKEYYVATPLPYKVDILPEEEYQEGLLKEYQQIVGSLMHAANSLRFDISYSVGILARMVKKVDQKLISFGYRVLNYLYATRDFKLMFKKENGAKNSDRTRKGENSDITPEKLEIDYIVKSSELTKESIIFIDKIEEELRNYEKKVENSSMNYQKNDFNRKREEKGENSMSCNNIEKKIGSTKLTAYVDADFAGDIDTRRSTTGIIICLANMPIYWKSKLQTSVASRTVEAEIIALYELSQEIMYYKDLLDSIGMKQKTIDIYEDNQAAIAIMTRPEKRTKMRHLDAKYFKIQEMVESKIIDIHYVKSANNVADLMTKVLPKAVHLGILKRLGLWRHQL
jgi:hypothetical protein